MKEKNLNEYRENLAKDLKDLKGTNPEMAKQVLHEEKNFSSRYKVAEKMQSEQREKTREKSILLKQVRENLEIEENERQQVRKEILSKLTLEAQNDLENVKFDFYGLTLGEKTKQEVLEELKKNNVQFNLGHYLGGEKIDTKEFIDGIDFSSQKEKETFIVLEQPIHRYSSDLLKLMKKAKKYGLTECSEEEALLFALPENLKRKSSKENIRITIPIREIKKSNTDSGESKGIEAFGIGEAAHYSGNKVDHFSRRIFFEEREYSNPLEGIEYVMFKVPNKESFN